jgi:hypothetical protein
MENPSIAPTNTPLSLRAAQYVRMSTEHQQYSKADRDGDEQAACAAAAWPQRGDLTGSLDRFFNPPLTLDEREIAVAEEWILGVE